MKYFTLIYIFLLSLGTIYGESVDVGENIRYSPPGGQHGIPFEKYKVNYEKVLKEDLLSEVKTLKASILNKNINDFLNLLSEDLIKYISIKNKIKEGKEFNKLFSKIITSKKDKTCYFFQFFTKGYQASQIPKNNFVIAIDPSRYTHEINEFEFTVHIGDKSWPDIYPRDDDPNIHMFIFQGKPGGKFKIIKYDWYSDSCPSREGHP